MSLLYNPNNSVFDLIPDEIVYSFLLSLTEPIDIYNASLVCRRFYHITNDSYFIKK